MAPYDNQHALSCSDGHELYTGDVALFNVDDGDVLRTFCDPRRAGAGCSLALLPDGLRFVSGGVDQTARIVYHGLALGPEQAWIDATPMRVRAAREKALPGARAALYNCRSAVGD